MRSLQSDASGDAAEIARAAEIVSEFKSAADDDCVRIVYHDCSNRLRYDCATGEYVLIRLLPSLTQYNTLPAVLKVRTYAVMDDFDFDERLALRHAVSRQWGVPQYLVFIHDIVPEDVLRPDIPEAVRRDELFASFAGAQLLQEPVCQLCAGEQLLMFASAGTVDDPFSCPRECAEGLDGVGCQEHARPQCLAGQFLLAGTATSDAQCVQCSGCQGKRFVAACSAKSDTVCEDCPTPAARQYWHGTDCSPVCLEGFVWNTRQLECEFCAKTICEPGWTTPQRQDNCSHCVPCGMLPPNAHWSTQDDRFDCMWLCDENYELLDMTCVAQVVVQEDSLVVPEAVCDAGHIPVILSCVQCFAAQSMGIVAQKDLPLKQEVAMALRLQVAVSAQQRLLGVAVTERRVLGVHQLAHGDAQRHRHVLGVSRVQFSFHDTSLPPPFLPASASARVNVAIGCFILYPFFCFSETLQG